jgi:small-conductance mechanosensitive channel
MPAADLATVGSFVDDHANEITAAATVLVSFALARVTDRALVNRGLRMSELVSGRPLSPESATRLRLVRRLVFATIILLGIALALAQFPSVKRLATGILASSAVVGLIVGFAARQTLANGIAGILLAITQPIRIGDLVTFEGKTGEVEDVRLTYTYIRLDDGRRLIIPNERLAQSSLENHTIIDPRVQVEVSVWLAPDADATRAIELLSECEGVEDVRVAEIDKEGIRLGLTSFAESARDRGRVSARLRQESLHRLRDEALSSKDPG